MMTLPPELDAHLQTGLTSLCWCWKLSRRDGTVFGFTDHDRTLTFGGVVFRADTGLSAQAVQQTTGLAVDNTEAIGALSDAALTEADIMAGRYDGAGAEAWLVNWREVSVRALMFRGTLGEITRRDGRFHAELRGLTEALNQPRGQIYQKPCSAVLGDERCRFDLKTPGYRARATVDSVIQGRVFRFSGLGGFADNWFEGGHFEVLTGAAAGLAGLIRNDRQSGGTREIELWDGLRGAIRAGDRVRLGPGCDKRPETCRRKFRNFLNFRGFPHIPGNDWLMVHPSRSGANTGGSMN